MRSSTVPSGSGYRQVGCGKSVSNSTLSSPILSIRPWRSPPPSSNQNVAYQFVAKYSDGLRDIWAACSGAFSKIS
jgi:hypothetical protein